MNKIIYILISLFILCCNPYEHIYDNIKPYVPEVYDYAVIYKITGTATEVFVTLSNSSGGVEQYDNVSVPALYDYIYFADDFVYISAQNKNTSGSVTVTIYLKDSYYKSATSEGAYVIATASGLR